LYTLPNTEPNQTPLINLPSTNSRTLKALQTIVDYTIDQLNLESEKYILHEFDEAAEEKLDFNGALLGL
jgi:hypothetical protein